MTPSPKALQNPEGQTLLVKHFETRTAFWDRGMPSPALIDILEGRQDLLNPFTADRRRKRALVPGCGKGYDAVMLALHGFDVFGLEVSETGAEVAREYARAEFQSPKEYNFGSSSSSGVEAGQVAIIQGDFFKKEWKNRVRFDLIYDYMFPMFKDLKLPGPPWGLNGVHWNLLAAGGDGIVGVGEDVEGEEKGAFTRLL
ncbi:S-adenosyl-L-methionine-dependent methyltransferase [Aspergillus alliaceus]|uniref:S-adenosyl-L-methionine-dependent methyltransferase n=1 Tax=Petromyces alliaceus TaxID=209559 RepID=A0A5N7BRW2_PETAA|nr:S-adenosyl-L-methionine-dependent methyltransferase [Aspergillus alliaceus]